MSLPVDVAVELRKRIDWDALRRYSEYKIGDLHKMLEADLSEAPTAHIRGQIHALRQLQTLEGYSERISSSGQ